LGPAAQHSGLDIGTEILAVNGSSLENATHADAVALLKQNKEITLLLRPNDVWKSICLHRSRNLTYQRLLVVRANQRRL
jgi:C-terminal processing protease CtpA/Prc